MNKEIEQYFRMLELEPGATLEQLRAARRELTIVWHPDRFAHSAPSLQRKAHDRMKDINVAYDVLERYLMDSPGSGSCENQGQSPPGSNPGPSQSQYQANGGQSHNSPPPSSPPHGPDSKRGSRQVRVVVAVVVLVVAAMVVGVLLTRSTDYSESSSKSPYGLSSADSGPPDRRTEVTAPASNDVAGGAQAAAPNAGNLSRNSLLYCGTTNVLANAISPPFGLIDFVLSCDSGDSSRLFACLSEEGLPATAVEQLFAVAQLSLNDDDYPDYFVRPAVRPYCGVFYGAHLFRYWFVTSSMVEGKASYDIAYKDGTDEIYVLPEVTNGYHDLQIMNFMRGAMYYDKLQFNGHEYVVGGSRVVPYGSADSASAGGAPTKSEEAMDIPIAESATNDARQLTEGAADSVLSAPDVFQSSRDRDSRFASLNLTASFQQISIDALPFEIWRQYCDGNELCGESSTVDIRQLDLNRDGVMELVIKGGPGYCGSGGCSIVIFAKSDHLYREISEFFGDTIEPTGQITNGWTDLDLGYKHYLTAGSEYRTARYFWQSFEYVRAGDAADGAASASTGSASSKTGN